MKTYDLIGQRFGRLTVTSAGPVNPHQKRTWVCRCDCGKETAVITSHLRDGTTKSCGCAKHDGIRAARLTHGRCYTRAYRIWINMNARCHRLACPSYPQYGGRGITVCGEWRHDFAAFHRDMGDPPADMTLDRIDNALGYSPDNCRWATRKQQSQNSSRPIVIEYRGHRKNLSEWAEYLGISTGSLAERIRRMPIGEALSFRKASSRRRGQAISPG